MADMAFTDLVYTDWKAISIGVAVLSIVVCVMLIMLSRLFSLRNLEQVAKTEFVYAVSTVVIVIMVLTLIGVVEDQLTAPGGVANCLYLTSFGQPCTSGTQIQDPDNPGSFLKTDTLIDWMNLYMSAPAHCVPQFMRLLYTLEIPVGAMTSVYMEIFMSEQASGFGLKWVEERIMNAVQSFTFYMYIFYLLGHLFEFIKFYAGFFFSIGVALRAFPPTRGAGAYVMALSFGLYFVFPLSYVVIATLFMPHAASDIVSIQNTGGSFQELCVLPTAPDVSMLNCGASDVGNAFILPSIISSAQDTLTQVLTVQIDGLGKHMVYVICIFPLIAFTILLTFVLNTTTLFGGNIPEIGRGIVKLI